MAYRVIMGRMTIEFDKLDDLDGFLRRHGALPGADAPKELSGVPELDREPLNRRTLLLALQLHSAFLTECDDVSLQEWSDFMCHHGAELLALALAAVERIDKQRRGTYEKHTLGPAQKRIHDLLTDGIPRTVSEIAADLGKNYQNTRHMMPVLEARGLVCKSHDPLKAAQVWMIAKVQPGPVALEVPAVPTPTKAKHTKQPPKFSSPEVRAAMTPAQRTQEHVENMRYIEGWDDETTEAPPVAASSPRKSE